MSSSQMQTDDQYFAALAGAGVTVFVSSGDGGSSPGTTGHDHTGPVQVESPANDPNVTAVGGTSLNLDASGAVSSETAWYDGGGGVSTFLPDRPGKLGRVYLLVQSGWYPMWHWPQIQRPAGSSFWAATSTSSAARVGARRPGQVSVR